MKLPPLPTCNYGRDTFGPSHVSQIRTKRNNRQYPANRESLFESDHADGLPVYSHFSPADQVRR